jgi:hypothetical protein
MQIYHESGAVLLCKSGTDSNATPKNTRKLWQLSGSSSTIVQRTHGNKLCDFCLKEITFLCAAPTQSHQPVFIRADKLHWLRRFSHLFKFGKTCEAEK